MIDVSKVDRLFSLVGLLCTSRGGLTAWDLARRLDVAVSVVRWDLESIHESVPVYEHDPDAQGRVRYEIDPQELGDWLGRKGWPISVLTGTYDDEDG